MEKRELIYEGKAKRVYSTDDENLVVIEYKDDATAFDGKKKGTIESKGIVNNRVTSVLFKILEDNGIPTHLVKLLDGRNMLAKKLSIIPVEVVVRNRIAGSLATRLGLEEGAPLPNPILEFYYKSDELHDPMVNEYHILTMGWATPEQLAEMKEMALKINSVLVPFLRERNLELVDFKLEFGVHQGKVILGDEISPDTCRLWDVQTGEKLDKDRFRRDLGKEREAYIEVLQRMEGGSLNV
ncbi:MAG TPA: phosphoribosylaminoimidazolesuccinocarboxamide synthase [Syntrophothermus lipocalidus]|uniref:Phosphoribosylaminoimidazole-succinocarboxamide synthase n=1 Tax=Syntrophothermus lipocalidus (strain DSM 12680 / TGB-C1) TaxID=643648 RepID=D7CKZ7_SYNLT|nr:phosphoribosylaminoimidazolesuccinocarboxamide synthase [Syntrophothermus lipocalidus]ADI01382.1 phosphoribosylaminoimidazole-succinocarboxamide synthase [Syntrophothermus lipocalidus DSM 12680]HHV77421.1 phosphoribosylaminoimidazolesuccinocarboxamide synthase [Syntrophothermus lipocalidus]HOV42599.1 phosphoribosylaminoimidazolesuccinocarboxamide synthase [Syntrophothermus lipocalidus]